MSKKVVADSVDKNERQKSEDARHEEKFVRLKNLLGSLDVINEENSATLEAFDYYCQRCNYFEEVLWSSLREWDCLDYFTKEIEARMIVKVFSDILCNDLNFQERVQGITELLSEIDSIEKRSECISTSSFIRARVNSEETASRKKELSWRTFQFYTWFVGSDKLAFSNRISELEGKKVELEDEMESLIASLNEHYDECASKTRNLCSVRHLYGYDHVRLSLDKIEDSSLIAKIEDPAISDHDLLIHGSDKTKGSKIPEKK